MRQRIYQRSTLAAIAIVGLLGMGWAGCANRTEMPTAPLSSTAVEKGGVSALGILQSPKSSADYCALFTAFDFRNFSDPTRIDNPWSPLVPGTQYVLEGFANRGGGALPHRVVFTVTDVTKEIHGIRCVVLWDQDFNEDKLVEAELAFFAQDNDGNIWTLGEYPEEYDIVSGEFLGAPSTWIHGLDGAQGGTLMLANPKNGTGYYLQGYVQSIEFLDCAKVYKTGLNICTPLGCYDNVLLTDEKSPLDHGSGHQRKYYAPGIGNIMVGAVGDRENETLVMTQYKQLNPQELAAARAEVLRLDARGYQFSDVYALTPRAR